MSVGTCISLQFRLWKTEGRNKEKKKNKKIGQSQSTYYSKENNYTHIYSLILNSFMNILKTKVKLNDIIRCV